MDFAVEVKEVLGEGGGQCRRGDCGGGLRGGMGRWKRWGNGKELGRLWGFERGGEGVEKGLRL